VGGSSPLGPGPVKAADPRRARGAQLLGMPAGLVPDEPRRAFEQPSALITTSCRAPRHTATPPLSWTCRPVGRAGCAPIFVRVWPARASSKWEAPNSSTTGSAGLPPMFDSCIAGHESVLLDLRFGIPPGSAASAGSGRILVDTPRAASRSRAVGHRSRRDLPPVRDDVGSAFTAYDRRSAWSSRVASATMCDGDPDCDPGTADGLPMPCGDAVAGPPGRHARRRSPRRSYPCAADHGLSTWRCTTSSPPTATSSLAQVAAVREGRSGRVPSTDGMVPLRRALGTLRFRSRGWLLANTTAAGCDRTVDDPRRRDSRTPRTRLPDHSWHHRRGRPVGCPTEGRPRRSTVPAVPCFRVALPTTSAIFWPWPRLHRQVTRREVRLGYAALACAARHATAGGWVRASL